MRFGPRSRHRASAPDNPCGLLPTLLAAAHAVGGLFDCMHAPMSAGAFSAALIFVNAGSPPARFGYAAFKGLRSRYSRCVVAYYGFDKVRAVYVRCQKEKTRP
jgi:hypothetical protein